MTDFAARVQAAATAVTKQQDFRLAVLTGVSYKNVPDFAANVTTSVVLASDAFMTTEESLLGAVEAGMNTHDWEMLESPVGDVGEAVEVAILTAITELLGRSGETP